MSLAIKKTSALSAIIIMVIFGSLAAYRYIEQIYYSIAYTKISDEIFQGIQGEKNQEAILAASFEYVREHIRKDMMPGMNLDSFNYLEYGYAFCDQQADVLMNILYYQGVESRLVPLYNSDGTSPHTFMEWNSGHGWLIIDPLYGYNLPITAKQLITLPKNQLASEYGVPEDAYDFYHQNLFSAIRNTYSTDTYEYWGPIKEKKLLVSKIFDNVSSIILEISRQSIPYAIQSAYLLKKYDSPTAENKYLIARNKLLFSDSSNALYLFKNLLSSEAIDDDWPGFAKYSINRKMLNEEIGRIQKR